MVNNIVLIMFCISIFGCATTRNKQQEAIDKFPATYRVLDIELRPHQILPIEYLLQHPEQKGLLLAHYLGTGKTFTALAFTEKNPHQKVIILAPPFLKANWLLHMNKMGIKNQQRYQFLSLDKASDELINKDITSTIVIVDEVHRLIEGVKSQDNEKRKKYSALFYHLKNAHRILLLSGTPVFNELSDISYAFNLAAGKDVLPYNERLFLDNFTQVKKGPSFWRGHLTESNLLIFGLPFVLAGIPLAFITPSIAMVGGFYFAGLAAGFTIFPIVNASLPLKNIPMRYFDADKFKDLTKTYVSYYDFRRDNDPAYPTQEVHEISVDYNEPQTSFFMDFADMSLTAENLKIIAREKAYGINNNKSNLDIESSSIQKELRSWPDSGREIGNLSLTDTQGKMIEPAKFQQALKIIEKAPDGVVVYSSYFENGIKLFAEFLDRHNKRDAYKILHPDLPTKEQMAIIDAYNAKKLPILLLHPIFTEGISLEQTRQLHILEPIPSQALFEQIIGRTIRYNSHANLSPKERHVDIYAWKANFGGLSAFMARNKNWGKRFNEINSAASFGSGLTHIDPNFGRKQLSFDEATDLKRSTLKNAMQALNELFKTHSVEHTDYIL